MCTPCPAAAKSSVVLWSDVTAQGYTTAPGRAERWMQNILLALSVALIGHVLTTLTDVSQGIADLRPRMEQMEINLALTYRASDARRDAAETSARLSALETRVHRLERPGEVRQ